MKNKKAIIFIDSGDTLVDESTEIRSGDVVVKADLIPGSSDLLKLLKKQGYIIVLVADGLRESFLNVYKQHNLLDCFTSVVDSETVGVIKPGYEMFEAAMAAADLTDNDKKRIIMVGNNLERDITGANRFGITSVFLDWTPRYRKEPGTKEEIPYAVIHEPMELLYFISSFESEMGQ